MYSVKVCILSFISGVFFFFLVLSSGWWIPVGVTIWGLYFYLEDRHPELFSSRPD